MVGHIAIAVHPGMPSVALEPDDTSLLDLLFDLQSLDGKGQVEHRGAARVIAVNVVQHRIRVLEHQRGALGKRGHVWIETAHCRSHAVARANRKSTERNGNEW